MKPKMVFRCETDTHLVVGSLDKKPGRIVRPVDDVWHNDELLGKFRL